MAVHVLYSSHPAMFRNRPVAFVICLVPLFWPILLVWWLKAIGTTLMVTDHTTVLREGIVARHTNEVAHRDVRNIQVSQGIMDRVFGVGAIGIASAGHSEIEIAVPGIRHPRRVRELINTQRYALVG